MQDEWTEKYRPKTLTEIVGNEQAARELMRWAESWRTGRPRQVAIVLEGDPGTGKTSAALALARDMGWDFIEMNASDHRNAASIGRVAGAGSVTQTFSASGEFHLSSKGKRKLVIIDEADNLSGKLDRGGAKEIVDTVRSASQPVILIVNDYDYLTKKSPALKSIAGRARFRRLNPLDIVRVLRGITQKESVSVTSEALEHIARNAGGDLRAAINDLQMIVEGKTSLDRGDSEVIGERNQQKELNASLNAMYGSNSASEAVNSTRDLDMDPEELVRWIEESIPVEMRSIEDLESAFDSLSKADVYLGRTRRMQYYALWKYARDMMTAGVSLARKHGTRSRISEYSRPGQFKVWGMAKGPREARMALTSKLSPYLHTSRKTLTRTVLPLLSVLVAHDRELLVHLTREVDLDEGDIALLLGLRADDDAVARVVAEARPAAEDSDAQAKSKAPGRAKRSTSSF